jgi:hypothetical protein
MFSGSVVMKRLTSLISKSVEWIIDAGSCFIGGTFGVLIGRSVRGTVTAKGGSVVKRSCGGRVSGTADETDFFGSCLGVVRDSSVTSRFGDAISADRAGAGVGVSRGSRN